MFTWKKLGRIFNPKDFSSKHSWMYEFAQAPNTVVFDDFVRVYFCCRPQPDEKGNYVSYAAYVDLSRENLFEIIRVAQQPLLTLGDIGTFDEFGTYPFCVIRDDASFRAYYGGWTRCESVPFNVALGVAVSDDGEQFRRVGPGPVLSYSPDEPFILSSPKIRKYNDQWFLFYIAGKKWITTSGRPEPVYRIRMAISSDGYNWNKTNIDLIEPRIEPDECQASPDVIYRNNRYHMFYCYRYSTDYRNKARGYRIGYAHSDDLMNWTRDDNTTGIDVSESGWDSEMVSYPHVFELDGKIYMLYLGNEVGRYGFGLAVLEGDLL